MQESSEEFLDLYRQMEDLLERRYQGEKRRYSSVVFEFCRDDESEPVRDKLQVCRELRNLLTHTPNLQGQPVAQPSGPMLEAMRQVLEFVKRPPLAIEFATKGETIMTGSPREKVLPLMAKMEKRGFSHVPVLEQGRFCGVFSIGTVFRYLLQSGGKGISPEDTVRDLGRVIALGDHLENYRFVCESATYSQVRAIFERVSGKNGRISVVFITQSGKEDEKLLGMVTPWDVLGGA